MTKKIIDTDAITNELEGASLFFSNTASKIEERKPVNVSPAPLPEGKETIQAYSEEKQSQNRTDERTDVRTDERTEIKVKRQKIRHAFDIYEDQLRDLQLLQFRAVQKGKMKPKLGRMVQEAIDLFLSKTASKKKQG